MTTYLFLLIVLMSFAVAWLASSKAQKKGKGDANPKNTLSKMHSRPIYHGLNAAVWTGVPSFVFLLLWTMISTSVVGNLVMASFPNAGEMDANSRSIVLSEIRQVAAGHVFKEPSPEVLAAVDHMNSLLWLSTLAQISCLIVVLAIGAYFGLKVIERRFRARHSFEQSITWFMLFSSIVAVITTLGIVVSLVFEAAHFFSMVPFHEFLFGLKWEPQIAMRSDQVAGQGAFGVVPVLYGTIVISLLAMAVAVPTGIFSAIFLTEYSSPRFRAVVKPVLEILAGIPTVVYGFFAVLTVAPMVRNFGLSLGLTAEPNSALSAGLVMGVMIIPFISSLSDDAFSAVPRAMRDGSLALGATKGETIRKVLLPAALPGIIGGVILAFSRAIGETMIVVMAAGLIATLTLNPLSSVTTVTVQIVTLLIGDAEFDNPKTLAAFALGLVLFVFTLILNLIALRTVQKFREKY